MKTFLTRKINEEWDFNSIKGKNIGGIICHNCGEMIHLAYQKLTHTTRFGMAYCAFCPNCFQGDKGTALTCRYG